MILVGIQIERAITSCYWVIDRITLDHVVYAIMWQPIVIVSQMFIQLVCVCTNNQGMISVDGVRMYTIEAKIS